MIQENQVLYSPWVSWIISADVPIWIQSQNTQFLLIQNLSNAKPSRLRIWRTKISSMLSSPPGFPRDIDFDLTNVKLLKSPSFAWRLHVCQSRVLPWKDYCCSRFEFYAIITWWKISSSMASWLNTISACSWEWYNQQIFWVVSSTWITTFRNPVDGGKLVTSTVGPPWNQS